MRFFVRPQYGFTFMCVLFWPFLSQHFLIDWRVQVHRLRHSCEYVGHLTPELLSKAVASRPKSTKKTRFANSISFFSVWSICLLCVDCHSVDEPHDQNPEQRSQLDDVPDEHWDSVQGVDNCADFACERHGDDVSVTYIEHTYNIRAGQNSN